MFELFQCQEAPTYPDNPLPWVRYSSAVGAGLCLRVLTVVSWDRQSKGCLTTKMGVNYFVLATCFIRHRNLLCSPHPRHSSVVPHQLLLRHLRTVGKGCRHSLSLLGKNLMCLQIKDL